MTIAENVAHEKGTLKPGCRISRGWFERFMKRQPQLSLRKGDATANVRMDCVNRDASGSPSAQDSNPERPQESAIPDSWE